jgi:hypothetical protein
VAIVDNFEEIATLLAGERGKAPVVEGGNRPSTAS